MKNNFLKIIEEISSLEPTLSKGVFWSSGFKKAIELIKAALDKQESKKVFVLFMSHRSGDHGLSIHNSMDELKAELKSVIELIKENKGIDEREIKEAYNSDLECLDEVCDGYFKELSDSTWFDVFVKEV